MKLAVSTQSCANFVLCALVFLALHPMVMAQEDDPDAAKFKAISESDTMIMVPMRDGVGLATDVYLPKGVGPFPVILVKTPYDFNKIQKDL